MVSDNHTSENMHATGVYTPTCSHWLWPHMLQFNLFLKEKEFTLCKAGQPLWGMELQEKEVQNGWSIQEICLERTYRYKA